MIFRFLRRLCYELHLWLGIVSGIILFVVCLSGTIYVFHEEAQRIAEPVKYFVDVPKDREPLDVDELIAKVEAVKPGMAVASITIPEYANRTVTMTLAQADRGREGRGGGRGEGRGPRPEDGRGLEHGRQGGGQQGGQQGGRPNGGGRGRNAVYVNPYTGGIVGEGASVVDPFFMSMMRLHRFLWFSGDWRRLGKMIVGIATIVFVVLCLTGLVLWLPRSWKSFRRRSSWKIGLRVRLRKGLWPFLYDTHNTLGFYCLVPALVLALTGLCWSFAWYRDGASALLGDQIFKGRRFRPETIERVDGTGRPFSVGEMIARQNELTPGPGEISVTIPRDRATAMVIQKGRTGFFSLIIKDRTQWDRFRGTVVPVEHHGRTVEVERFSEKPLGAQIAASIRAVHFGNITGLSSKLFFAFVCLLATTWPVTGVLFWIKKLRAKRRQRDGGVKPPKSKSPPITSGA